MGLHVFSALEPNTSGSPIRDDDTELRKPLPVPSWVLLALALLLGGMAAALIVRGQPVFVMLLVSALPITVLFLRYPFAAVLFWLLVFPFVALDESAGGRFMYWVLHRAMIPGALLIAVLADWFGMHRHRPVRFGRAELVMVLFLALTVVNIMVLTSESTQNLIRFYDRLFVPFCMYWLVRITAPSAHDLERLSRIGLLVVVTQSTIGMLGWFSPSTLPPQWLGRSGERVVGTFGNPAVFTSTLLFLAVFLLQYAMQRVSSMRRLPWSLGIALVVTATFLSFSRGSWVGGLLVWGGLLFVYPRTMLRFTAGVLIIGLPLLLAVAPEQLSYARTRLETQGTAEGRILQTVTQLNMVQQKPIFGWGFYNYDLHDEQFKTRVGNIAMRYREQTSHNTFLLMATEMGIPALLLYLFPTFWWLRLTRMVWPRLPRHGFRSRHLVALLWLVMLDHFTVNNFMEMLQSYPLGTTIWWLALGLIASLVYPHLKPRDLRAPKWVRVSANQSRAGWEGPTMRHRSMEEV
jgi:O-antigen ligase